MKKDIIYILVIIVLFIGMVFMYNNNIKNNNRFENYEKTINALNDSVHVMIVGNKKTFYQQSPEIIIKELINSEYFKTLSKEQQLYYTELSKIKGLISSTKAELEKQGNLLDKLVSNPGTIKNDSISFKVGTILKFEEKDTTKKLQWKSDVTLGKDITFNLDYNYKFDIQTTFERQKDKSIIVKYTMNDPELKVNKMFNYTIPVETKTKFQTWYDKNKRPIMIIGGSALFVGGGITGIVLTK